ncbi:MAG: hypothetical protein NTX27_20245 [Verrucomicrobia bacterium]|nr:hypothetical protein [Verrucomicrobiota bacterium]
MKHLLIWLAACLSQLALTGGELPEQLLPRDCVAVLAAPDVPRLQAGLEKLPWWRAWMDPSMASVRTNFQHELDASAGRPSGGSFSATWKQIVQYPTGPAALALIQNGWLSNTATPPALLFLCDVGWNRNPISTNLQAYFRRQAQAGIKVRPLKIHDHDFTAINLPVQALPEPVRRFLNVTPRLEVVPDGTNAPPTNSIIEMEWFVGQSDSMFLAGTDVGTLDNALGRLTNAPTPFLAENPLFQTAQAPSLSNALAYVWIDPHIFWDLLPPAVGATNAPPNSADTNPPPGILSVLKGAGVEGIQQARLTLEDRPRGLMLQSWLGLPAASRQGIFKILPGESLELDPPPFIPAETQAFRRWRLDGSKAWIDLEKWIGEASPQTLSVVNFLIQSVNDVEKASAPGFDVRRQLMANLGNDVLTYTKAAAAASNAPAPASLLILGVTNSEQVAASAKPVLLLLNPQAGVAESRDFLSNRIITVPFPTAPLPGVEIASPDSRLHFVAMTGYVAFSEDAPLLEEFIRNMPTEGKALKDTPGLNEAKAAVTPPGSTMFAWENDRETLRESYAAWKLGTDSLPTGNLTGAFLGLIGMSLPEDTARKWLDPALAPPFEQVERHFHISVSGAGADAHGFWHRIFLPTPPPASTVHPPDK